MTTQADVRRIALALPGTQEAKNHFAFSVKNKDKQKEFAWVWLERITPKKPRVPCPGVLAVRVANLGDKDLMISAEPAKFFTEPHYDGFPAVLVRLNAVTRRADTDERFARGAIFLEASELVAFEFQAAREQDGDIAFVECFQARQIALRLGVEDCDDRRVIPFEILLEDRHRLVRFVFG